MQELLDRAGVAYDVPILPGSTAVVKAKMQEGVDLAGQDVSLVASDGIKIVTPAVRVPDLSEVTWRIMATGEGDQSVTLRIGDAEIKHAVHVGETERFRKIETVMARGAWAELWNPGLPPLPDSSPVVEFSIQYPEAKMSLLGIELHWVIIFFILSFVFAFAIKGFLGIEI